MSKLAERIAVALHLLRKVGAKRTPHDERCMGELDPDYMGPCTCGADKLNANLVPAEVKEAIKVLEGEA